MRLGRSFTEEGDLTSGIVPREDGCPALELSSEQDEDSTLEGFSRPTTTVIPGELLEPAGQRREGGVPGREEDVDIVWWNTDIEKNQRNSNSDG